MRSWMIEHQDILWYNYTPFRNPLINVCSQELDRNPGLFSYFHQPVLRHVMPQITAPDWFWWKVKSESTFYLIVFETFMFKHCFTARVDPSQEEEWSWNFTALTINVHIFYCNIFIKSEMVEQNSKMCQFKHFFVLLCESVQFVFVVKGFGCSARLLQQLRKPASGHIV